MRSTNDGSSGPAALRLYMSMLAVDTMPEFAGRNLAEKLSAIKDAGFDGIQFNGAAAEAIQGCREAGLGVAESGRINAPAEADPMARRCAELGAECVTVHLGWGLESEEEGLRLIDAVFGASAKYDLPIYPETHRATLFQDMWRTVQFIEIRPEIRFNGDFSHWYTGSEMVYGDVDWKLEFLAPVFDRVRFMHGRIGDPGCMQVPLRGAQDDQSFVGHFREMWLRAFRGFLKTASAGDYLCFSPELLAPDIFYSRTMTNGAGEEVEVSNRWRQSLLLNDIARECFERARAERDRLGA